MAAQQRGVLAPLPGRRPLLGRPAPRQHRRRGGDEQTRGAALGGSCLPCLRHGMHDVAWGRHSGGARIPRTAGTAGTWMTQHGRHRPFGSRLSNQDAGLGSSRLSLRVVLAETVGPRAQAARSCGCRRSSARRLRQAVPAHSQAALDAAPRRLSRLAMCSAYNDMREDQMSILIQGMESAGFQGLRSEAENPWREGVQKGGPCGADGSDALPRARGRVR